MARHATFPFLGLFFFLFPAGQLVAQPLPQAVSVFDSYVSTVESRLARQHQSQTTFLAGLDSQREARLQRGDLIIEQLAPHEGSAFSGALLHDWRGTAFIASAKAADFERIMKNFSAYPRYFSPQVVQARVLSENDDDFQIQMRLRQQHLIPVVLDTVYEIRFGRLNPQRGYSISRSTRISEIESPGSSKERALEPTEERGFLWRLNTYWSYEERPGGLYIQIESISLTRSIPYGLTWAIRPYVQSIPRESLEFTLRSTCAAIRSQNPHLRMTR